MFDWKGLLKKEYTMPLKIDDDVKHFKYKEYTIKETLELHYQEEDPAERLFDFLNNHAVSEEDKMDIETFNLLPLSKLYKKVLSTLCKGYYSFDDKETWWNSATYPVSAYITYICWKLSIDPDTFIEKYTFRQLKYLSDGIIWNENEKTEEWQKSNKKKLKKYEFDNMDKDAMQAQLDKLRNKHKKDLSNKGT